MLMLIESVIVAIIGFVAGGFVNALADDLPLRRSPRLPRYVPLRKKFAIHSSDPEVRATTQEDDEPRPVLAWLGLTAFLFGRRTSSTGVTLGWRYPLTEILTAGLMLLTLDAVTDNPNLTNVGTLQLLFWLTYMAIFALITVIDIEHKLILFVVIIPSAILALIDALLTTALPESFGMKAPGIAEALLGGALGFLMFFMLYNGGALFTYVLGKLRGEAINEVAFGYGDVMMATVSGLILGWRTFIIAIVVIIFLGAFGAAIYLISRKVLGQRYSAFTALPYGPYIVAGTILLLLYRVPVTDFVLNR
jgi:prepilin signal peptidase PulO-like enzyme (type II secretory pathway)